MHVTRSSVCLILLTCLAGCDATGTSGSANATVKFDATTLETQKASSQKMTAGLPEEQVKAFINDMTTVAAQGHSGTAGGSSAEEFMKPLQGMTKEEIEARAREIRARESAANPQAGGPAGK